MTWKPVGGLVLKNVDTLRNLSARNAFGRNLDESLFHLYSFVLLRILKVYFFHFRMLSVESCSIL